MEVSVHPPEREHLATANRVQRGNTEATMTSQWRDSYNWEIGSTSGYSSVGYQRERMPGTGSESETDAASILRREGLRGVGVGAGCKESVCLSSCWDFIAGPSGVSQRQPIRRCESSSQMMERERIRLEQMWEPTSPSKSDDVARYHRARADCAWSETPCN
jgi:hypothetical protein